MTFDTIIIGGGLSALTAGIRLAKAKQHVAMIGTGQSSLLFNAGSFDLLGFDAEGKAVQNPLEAIASLPAGHPYHKVSDIRGTIAEAKDLLSEASIIAAGDDSYNHYRLSPIGMQAPTWLSLDGMLTTDGKTLPYKDIVLANIEGFLDFHTEFLRPALEQLGAHVTVSTFTTPELTKARKNPSEFRATTLGNYLDNREAAMNLAQALNALPKADAIIIPAILGLRGDIAQTIVREQVKTPVLSLATMHPSRCGMRIQEQLRRLFTDLGGEVFLSDTVERADIDGSTVKAVYTHNMVEEPLRADNFIIATGSFMSRGLSSNYQTVWEPIFHADVNASKNRGDWHDPKFFNTQAFLSYGVVTDEKLHVMKDGKALNNLYAAGTILADNDFNHYADHEGVDMLTALEAAKNILL